MNVGAITFGPLLTEVDARVRARELADRYREASVRTTVVDGHACGCVGPQPGETKCPCRLRAESEQGRRMISDGVVIDGKPYKLVPA